ncbi:MAG: YbaL family putative K(+) efflux transporter [Hyphomonadaceae bacterium]
MPHHTPLLATIAAGIGLAFLLGLVANRLKLSPLVGYLLAGVLVGPFTPGFVADQALANELAELGVILLMFGVGLHFSLKDLMAVRLIAVPGAIVQMATATGLGVGLGYLFGWPLISGLVFGLALSVASTVVLLKALQERHIVQTERGRIAVGWLIVEDLAMVLALVLLPVAAQMMGAAPAVVEPGHEVAATGDTWTILLTTIFKVVAFVAFMLIVGRKVIPFVLHYVAHTGSRELFRLSVLAIALGVAFGAAMLFGVSFALGAFFAGMILSESELSHQAAEETLPLRDAFAVLFFVSAGMLFNPQVVMQQPLQLLATLAVILLGKSIAAFLIIRAFKHPNGTALVVSASLAQIGEFSFILATLGVDLAILPEAGRDLVIAGAIISIVLNPFVFLFVSRFEKKTQAPAETPGETDLTPTNLSGHAVVVGYGRVGQVLVDGLRMDGHEVLVIDDKPERVDQARESGVEALLGSGADADVVKAMNVELAKLLFVAIPNPFEAGQVVAKARAANAALKIVARAHSDEEVTHLKTLGADEIIMGERELAQAMLMRARDALRSILPPAAEPPVQSA